MTYFILTLISFGGLLVYIFIGTVLGTVAYQWTMQKFHTSYGEHELVAGWLVGIFWPIGFLYPLGLLLFTFYYKIAEDLDSFLEKQFTKK